MYLNQTGKKLAFKTLTEEKVEESTIIPKVNSNKDFRNYLRTINEGDAATEYLTNHPTKCAEA